MMHGRRALVWLFALVAVLVLMAAGHRPASADPAGNLYLPLVAGGSGTDETPTLAAGATWLPFSATPDGVVHTRGTNLALDGRGGVHVGYAIRTGLDGSGRPAYYAYCATGCHREENWTRLAIEMDEWVLDVRIALDSGGRPRMMIYSSPPNDSEGLGRYTYAACNGQCTNAASWTLTPITVARLMDTTRWDYVFRYFALDPQGHPAFLYTDGSQGIDHNGTFYATCLAAPNACSEVANWSEIKLDPHWLGTPSLAFSPTGQPRVALYYYDNSDDALVMELLYLACDANCLDAGNWQGLFLADLHGTSRYSLRVDSQGRPRMIFYSGDSQDSDFQRNRLYYLWCNTNCTLAGQHDWQMDDLGLPAYHGQNADLALTSAGRPRIAYDAFGSALGYAWCDAGCESDTAQWQHQVVEPSAALEQDYPVAPTRRCTISTWVTGQQPMLALDRADNAHVGYMAEHGYGGTDLDEPWKTCPTFRDIILARFMQFPQP